MSRITYTTLSPLKRRVTIRKHTFKGFEVVRGGKEVLTSEPLHDLVEAERFAKTYCDYWGDEYGGVEKG
jgi:hypothetical protein